MTSADLKNDVTTVQTLLGNYPNVIALKNGQVRSPSVAFDFADVPVPHDGFKPMVEGRFDAGELALVTFLQAKAYGKPLVLLPAVIVGKFRHDAIAYNAKRGDLTPADLRGRRVGVRSYSQTTGVWVRGVLQNDYGVDLNRVKWLTFQEGHLAEYRDPADICERAPAGSNLTNMLLKGDVDAAMLGVDMPSDPQIKLLIPDIEAAERAWYRKHRAVPINHMFVVRESLSKSRPDVVREIFRLLVESKKSYDAANPHDIDLLPVGVEANRKSLELAIEYSFQQRIIPRRFTVDELFDDTTRSLGA
jgi:4,5-dihydroxyphthalate decarboxylase